MYKRQVHTEMAFHRGDDGEIGMAFGNVWQPIGASHKYSHLNTTLEQSEQGFAANAACGTEDEHLGHALRNVCCGGSPVTAAPSSARRRTRQNETNDLNCTATATQSPDAQECDATKQQE